jgi:Fungal specific transcription factor domain
MATVPKYFFYFTDRDTGRWKLDLNETERRREVFWELYVYDSWQASMYLRASISINVHFIQCLTFGRPPAFTTAHVDCKMPFQGEAPGEDACQYYTCSG